MRWLRYSFCCESGSSGSDRLTSVYLDRLSRRAKGHNNAALAARRTDIVNRRLLGEPSILDVFYITSIGKQVS
jgi:hypothetical protein